ncbi:MAG: type II toxin-antitoxin system Phd/YefM family antitoxin [Deltaproteobacteria bacterium]|nr:type II toxin-antitoxin system Phd/YefM family antitoxin [Deltaproteobacteria bacterium]
MSTVSVRELRNNVSEVLRRVEAGETVIVTSGRRPVARLVPFDPGPTWIPVDIAHAGICTHQADAALSGELRELLPDTTDDI